MKIIGTLFFTLFIFLIPGLQAKPLQSDSSKLKLDQLVEKKMLKEVREIHNKLDLSAFSRAYSSETYGYEVYREPAGHRHYYTCVMKVMRGAFIIEKYEFKANPDKGSIEVMDEKTKRYLSVDKWLVLYKDKVALDEQNKK